MYKHYQRVNQCINTITFKFVNSTCPYYLKEIFEFAPNCRIDTGNKSAKLKISFTQEKHRAEGFFIRWSYSMEQFT